VPVLTPPQTQPLQNYPPALRDVHHNAPESSVQDFPAIRYAKLNFNHTIDMYETAIILLN
jgi:hypothetical protein